MGDVWKTFLKKFFRRLVDKQLVTFYNNTI